MESNTENMMETPLTSWLFEFSTIDTRNCTISWSPHAVDTPSSTRSATHTSRPLLTGLETGNCVVLEHRMETSHEPNEPDFIGVSHAWAPLRCSLADLGRLTDEVIGLFELAEVLRDRD